MHTDDSSKSYSKLYASGVKEDLCKKEGMLRQLVHGQWTIDDSRVFSFGNHLLLQQSYSIDDPDSAFS